MKAISHHNRYRKREEKAYNKVAMYLNFHIDSLKNSALRAEGFQSGNHEYSMEIGLWAAILGAMSINTV